jgi:hypothetical protein
MASIAWDTGRTRLENASAIKYRFTLDALFDKALINPYPVSQQDCYVVARPIIHSAHFIAGIFTTLPFRGRRVRVPAFFIPGDCMPKTLVRDEYIGLGPAAAEIGMTRHGMLVQLATRGLRLERIGGHLMLRVAYLELVRAELQSAA